MKVSDSQLKTVIKEELEIMRLEKIMLSEIERIDKLHEEMQLEALSEGFKDEIVHTGLDVIGLIPGLGEVADLTNAGLYAKKGEYLMAAFSVISLIPAIGDAIGKGGKIGTYLSKFGVKGGGKASKALGKLLSKHMPKIQKTLKSLKSNKYVGKYVDDMAGAVMKYGDDIATKAADDVLPMLQKAVQTAPTPKVSKKKYVAMAQKVQAKRKARKTRRDIAQQLSGGEGEQESTPQPAAAPAQSAPPAQPAAPSRVPQQQRAAAPTPSASASGADDAVKSAADDVLRQAAARRKVAEQEDEEQQKKPKITPEMINDLLKGVEQFSKDPVVVDALGKDGLAGALQVIKSKIMAGEQPAASAEQGLAGVMEKKLTKPEKKEKEKIVKGMKKDKKGFKQRYGDDAESVMYATATKIAKEKK